MNESSKLSLTSRTTFRLFYGFFSRLFVTRGKTEDASDISGASLKYLEQ